MADTASSLFLALLKKTRHIFQKQVLTHRYTHFYFTILRQLKSKQKLNNTINTAASKL